MTLLLLWACPEPMDSAVGTPDDTTPVVDSPVDTEPQGCQDRGALSGEMCVLEAPCSWAGGTPRDYFGQAIAVGDLDADGAVELVVGAPGHAGTVGTGAGAVFVLAGQGFPARQTLISGPKTSDYYGSDVAIVPSPDGDRVLVGAMGVDDDAAIGVGAAMLLDGQGTELARWSGVDSYDRVGWTVHSGDHDGDGVADVWLTSDWRDADDDPGTGSANLFLGSDLVGGSIQDADLTLTGVGRATVGHAYVNGDFDGDGSVDLVVSAPYAEGYRGAVYRVAGGATPEALPEPWAVGEETSDSFGYRLAAADFDGDGTDELVVGAPLNDRADDAAGAVFVYSGQELVSVWTGEWMDVQAGTGLGTADVDQDGTPELLVGSVSAWRGLATHSGRVYAVDALAGGSLGDATVQVHGGSTKDYLGHPILGADIDGDGADDVLLGTAYVNKDGAYDVGSVYLFHGTP